MTTPEDRNLGALAVARGHITQQQVYECMELQTRYATAGGPIPSLGEILVMRGYIDEQVVEQLQTILSRNRHELFGEIAIRQKLCTREQIDYCVAVQEEEDQNRRPHRLIGQILVAYGYLQPEQINGILAQQQHKVITCTQCHNMFSVPPYRPGTKVRCPICKTVNIISETQQPLRPLSARHLDNPSQSGASRPAGKIVVRRDRRIETGDKDRHVGGGRMRRLKKRLTGDPDATAGTAHATPKRSPGQPVPQPRINKQFRPTFSSRNRPATTPNAARQADSAKRASPQHLQSRLRKLNLGPDRPSSDSPALASPPEPGVPSENAASDPARKPSTTSSSVAVLERPKTTSATTRAFDINLYAKVEELRPDGMGTRFIAKHKQTGDKVELLILGDAVAFDRQFVNRWLATAKRAIMLDHPFIRKMLHAGVSPTNQYYAILEYIDGQTVRDLLDGIGKFPIQEALGVLWLICQGLRHAHSLGLFHGNLRPEKIIIGNDGHPRISDIGLTVNYEQTIAVEVTRNRGEDVPLYIPPELAVEGQRADQRSDIYSLGSILYEMITGHASLLGDSPGSVLMYSAQENAVPPSVYDSRVPTYVDKMVSKMLATEPSARYQSIKQLAFDIQRIRQALERGQANDSDVRIGTGAVGSGSRNFSSDENAPRKSSPRTPREDIPESVGDVPESGHDQVDHLSETQAMPKVDRDIYGDEFVSLKRHSRKARKTAKRAEKLRRARTSERFPHLPASRTSRFGVFLFIVFMIAFSALATDMLMDNVPSHIAMTWIKSQYANLTGKSIQSPKTALTRDTGVTPDANPGPAATVPAVSGVPGNAPIPGATQTDGISGAKPTAPSEEAILLQKAETAYHESRLDQAIAILKELVRKSSDTPEGKLAANRLIGYTNDALIQALRQFNDQLEKDYKEFAFNKARRELDHLMSRYAGAGIYASQRRLMLKHIYDAETEAIASIVSDIDMLADKPPEELDPAQLQKKAQFLKDVAFQMDESRFDAINAQMKRLSAIQAKRQRYEDRLEEEKRRAEALRKRRDIAYKNLKALRKRFTKSVKIFELERAWAIVSDESEKRKFSDTILTGDYRQLLDEARRLKNLKLRLSDGTNRQNGLLKRMVVNYKGLPVTLTASKKNNLVVRIVGLGTLVWKWTDMSENDLDTVCRKVIDPRDAKDLKALGILHFARGGYSFADKAFSDALRLEQDIDLEPWLTNLKQALKDHPGQAETVTPAGFRDTVWTFTGPDDISKWTLSGFDASILSQKMKLEPISSTNKNNKATVPLDGKAVRVSIRMAFSDAQTDYLFAVGDKAFITLYPRLGLVKSNVGRHAVKERFELTPNAWYDITLWESRGKIIFTINSVLAAEMDSPGMSGKILIKTRGGGEIQIEHISLRTILPTGDNRHP